MLDFTQLPKDGVDFERLIREMLLAMGYRAYWSGKGPDGGRDLLCVEERESIFRPDSRTWLIECKHFARAGRSVGVDDLGDILTKCAQHSADAYLLACSTQPSSSVVMPAMISIPIVLPVCTDNAQVALNVGPHIPYGGSARAPQLYIRAALSHDAVEQKLHLKLKWRRTGSKRKRIGSLRHTGRRSSPRPSWSVSWNNSRPGDRSSICDERRSNRVRLCHQGRSPKRLKNTAPRQAGTSLTLAPRSGASFCVRSSKLSRFVATTSESGDAFRSTLLKRTARNTASTCRSGSAIHLWLGQARDI
jgi:Restriction endonuclease